MVEQFNRYIKRNLLNMLVITFILEISFLFVLKNQLSLWKLSICMFAIIVAVITGGFILSSLENCFYAFAVIIPLLPLAGYMSLLLGKIKLQFIIYVGFYILSFISILRNVSLKYVFSIKNLKNRDSVMKIGIVAFVLLNSILAFNKQISFMILMLGVIPSLIFFYLLKNIKFDEGRDEIFKNVILCLCVGVTLSGLPDFVKYIYANLVHLDLKHLSGPLGSNFLMSYSLITYPFVIVNSKFEKNYGRKNIYKIILVIQTMIICSQRSRGLLMALLAMFIILFIDYKSFKYYLLLIIIIIPCVTFNIYRREDVSDGIKAIKNVENVMIKNDQSNEKKVENIVDTFAKIQTSNRKPIWNAAAGIISEKPIIGVGSGNFQFFFSKYAPDKYKKLNINFLDAHNFILNSACELGIPFTLIMLCYFTAIVIRCFISVVRLLKSKQSYILFIPFISAIAAYFVFGNITGAAFHSVREGSIISFTPIFMFTFEIFYYNNMLTKLNVRK